MVKNAAAGALIGLHRSCIRVCMRTTLNLRDDLVQKAMAITHITEKTALVHAGLEALIAAEAARRLARLGGSDRSATAARRRRPAAR
jgi:Arc/MetJ family transcription regulator